MLNKYLNRSVGLSALRAVIGFIIVKKAIFLLPMAEQMFGHSAIAPMPDYLASLKYFQVPALYFPYEMPYGPQLYLLLAIVFGLLFVFGELSVFSGAVLYYLVMAGKMRNGFILDGSDNVIDVILPFIILADSYKYFRLELFGKIKWPASGLLGHFRPHALQLRRVVHEVALIGLLVQVCYVYFFTAIAKLQGDLWLNGTAVYYTMRVEEFRATDWNIPLTSNHYFVVLATYFTLFWEIAFAFLIWFRQSKFWVILGGVMLHGGIWMFMRIDDFSWVMMATYLAFVTNAEYKAIYAHLSRPRLTVLFDNWCPKCIRAVQVIRFFDILGNLRFLPLREVKADWPEVDMSRAEQAMPSISRKGEVSYGFDTLLHIAKAVPLFWIGLPAMWLLKWTGAGPRLYHEVASSRQLLHCSEEECRVPV